MSKTGLGKFGQAAGTSVLSGTTSVISGGSFFEGAVVGLIVHMCNRGMHGESDEQKLQQAKAKRKYKRAMYKFKGMTIVGDPDQDLGSDLSPSQHYRGSVSVKEANNGRYYAEGFAETFPGEGGGNRIRGNIRVYQNGEEVGFQYMSMKNEWGSHFYDADWNQVGYGRVYLPTLGDNVKVTITIYTYNNRWFFGSTSHILYRGSVLLPD